MTGLLAPPLAARTPPVVIQTLRPDDVAALRLPGRKSAQSLRQALERHPDRSVWAPATLEYALLGAWRNRTEIASVDELVAVRHTASLLDAAFERCVAHGDELMLAIELEGPGASSRFERAGLELLEEVITYETDVPRESWPTRQGVRLLPVTSGDNEVIDLIARIDQAAFPWLWRNSRTEFDVYLRIPGVEVALLEAGGEPIAYIGATHFAGWSHLDRIAVLPGKQGRGFGREALGLAVDMMRQQGARRAALSTQLTNWQSRRLYERFGFRRTYEHDYRLFGRWRRPDHRITGHPA
jgi:ribosomal protein S18 acetylase RimI-like enzyme